MNGKSVCEMLLLCASVFVVLSIAVGESDRPGSRVNRWQPTLTDMLRHDLLTGYDKSSRPSQFSGYVNVNFTLTVSHIVVDELQSMMVIKGWSYIDWVDDLLRWNASQYGGVDKLTLLNSEIWHPEVFLLNSAVGEHKDNYLDALCTVYSNGTVYWTPPSQFSTYCELDLRRWPYDKQVCHYFFSSWIEDGGHIVLAGSDQSIPVDHKPLDPCGWQLLDIEEMMHTDVFACCNEESNVLRVVVSANRDSSGYGMVVFVPAIACAMLTLAVFWVPPLSPEKFLLPGINSVITTVLLVYFSQLLPIKSDQTPFIVVFYTFNLMLVCISMMVTVGLGRKLTARPVRSVVNMLLSSPVSAYLLIDDIKNTLLSNRAQLECTNLQPGLEIDEPNTPQNICSSVHERILLITVMDRVMFVIYLLMFFLMGLSFYIV